MPFPFVIYNLKGLCVSYCDVFPSNFQMPRSIIAFFVAAILFYNVLNYGVNKCCIFLNIYLNKISVFHQLELVFLKFEKLLWSSWSFLIVGNKSEEVMWLLLACCT